MNSLEWRTKKLENKLLGQAVGPLVDIGQVSIYDQLDAVAKHYQSYLDAGTEGSAYLKFVALYNKYKNLMLEMDAKGQRESDEISKAELVLAYEDDLMEYMQDLGKMAEKAERVLDIQRWPDMSGFQERLDKLQAITKEQHLQSVIVDKKTEDLIGIYNDIIGSFKGNMAIWNEKLDAYERADKKPEEDE